MRSHRTREREPLRFGVGREPQEATRTFQSCAYLRAAGPSVPQMSSDTALLEPLTANPGAREQQPAERTDQRGREKIDARVHADRDPSGPPPL